MFVLFPFWFEKCWWLVVCVCGGCFEFFLGVVNIYIYSRLPLCLLGIAMFLFLVRFDGRGGELGWWGSSFFFFFFFLLFR